MGIYIEVPDSNAWLGRHAVPFTTSGITDFIDNNEVLLAHAIGPGPDGSVLAVIYSAAERQRWLRGRKDAVYYRANRAAVLTACPEAKDALKKVLVL